jgi:pimeloyl-ACP methyl ester carboxylesterase
VWREVIDELPLAWPGRWLAPDLPGHGRSAPLQTYTFAGLAEAVAPLLDPDAPAVVLGHSLGGVLALVLAGRADLDIRAAIGVGIKVAWTDTELTKASNLAERPVTWFDNRDDAARRHLLVSGLTGLLAADDPVVDEGLVEVDGRWRLALDPRAFGVGAPDVPGLLATSRCPTVLARGEHDEMVTAEQLAAVSTTGVTITGAGHNAHVDSPAAVTRLLGAYGR